MTAQISSKSSVSMNSWKNVSNNQAFFSKSVHQKRVNCFPKLTANYRHNKMDRNKKLMNLTVKTVNSLPVQKSYISEAKLFWITWKSVTTWKESISTISTNLSKVKTSLMEKIFLNPPGTSMKDRSLTMSKWNVRKEGNSLSNPRKAGEWQSAV